MNQACVDFHFEYLFSRGKAKEYDLSVGYSELKRD